MPVFKYRAVDSNGHFFTGVTDAPDTANAAESLRAGGLKPVGLKKCVLKNEIFSKFFKPALKHEDVSLFLSSVAYMLDAGLNIVYALRLVKDQTKCAALKAALSDIENGVKNGHSLSGELKKHKQIPAIVSGAAAVGEQTGRLPDLFFKLSALSDTEAKFADDIKKALIYPMIVSAAMVAVVVVSVVFVLPGYARIYAYAGGELPVATRALLNAGRFLSVYYGPVVMGLCCVFTAAVKFLNGAAGHYFIGLCKLKLPIVSKIYLKAVNMRFAYILGILAGSGMDMPGAVRLIARTLANDALTPIMEKISGDILNGTALSAALTDKAFDPKLAGMIKLGEETGRLPETALKCSFFLQHELDRMTWDLTKLIEPLITIALGLVLAFIMLAVMTPTFRLTNLL